MKGSYNSVFSCKIASSNVHNVLFGVPCSCGLSVQMSLQDQVQCTLGQKYPLAFWQEHPQRLFLAKPLQFISFPHCKIS